MTAIPLSPVSVPAMPRSRNVGTMTGQRVAMEKWWKMLRALRHGTDAMRDLGVELLPQDWRERSTPSIYAERLSRTFLHAAYDETVRKLASKPFAKAVTVGELPPPLDAIESDADRCGTSLTVFASRLFEDMVDRGFCTFLVDHVPAMVAEPDGTTRAMSLAEEEAGGVRPYFCRVCPDNLLGWKSEMANGCEVITELRIRGVTYRQGADFSEQTVETIHVWTPTTIEKWEKVTATNSKDPLEIERIYQQSIYGATLVEPPRPHGFSRIPVVIAYATRIDTLYARPPLLNLAWLNVQHWQSSSQQNWILHYSRAPLLKGSGMTNEEVERGIALGAGACALSSNPDFDLSYVEPSGTSLDAGRKDLEAIERQMEAMGAEPMASTQGPSTATGEVKADMRQASDLQKWAEALEWALYQAYEIAAEWRGETLPEDFDVTVFREFGLLLNKQGDMQLLQSDAQAGRISDERYLIEAKKRGLYGDDLDPEEEAAKVQEQQPPLSALTMPGQFGQPNAQDSPMDAKEPMDPAADPEEDAADAEDPEDAGQPVPPKPGRKRGS